jgi:hypothetical protein
MAHEGSHESGNGLYLGQCECSLYPHSISLRTILRLSYHLRLGHLTGIFPSHFPTKTPYALLFSPMPCPSHPPWLGLFAEECEVRNSSLSSFLQPPIMSSLFSPNILLSTLFSVTLNLCSSPNVRDQVSHPYKIAGKIIVLYILIFTYIDNRREDRRFWNEW